MIKFPHISLLRNVLTYVEHVNTDPEVPAKYRVDKPVTFTGTIKLHGANCGVVWDLAENTLQAQSRETVLTPKDDYKGFAKFVVEHEDEIRLILNHVLSGFIRISGTARKIALYGEWVGAGVVNRNKGSAVSKFDPKHWALFAVGALMHGEEEPRNVSDLLDIECISSVTPRIGNVRDIPDDWKVTIDFSDPDSLAAARDTVQAITDAVATECPYGKLYRLEGAGEGIVWMPTGEFVDRHDLYWKHKSEAHSVVMETKIKKERPTVPTEVQEAISTFVEATVTGNRLEQGIDTLEQQGFTVEKRNTGRFIKWLTDDVERECSLELADLGLQWGQVSNAVMTKARVFFLATAK